MYYIDEVLLYSCKIDYILGAFLDRGRAACEQSLSETIDLLSDDSHPWSLGSQKMPTEALDLADHVVILLGHESNYRQSRGPERQGILKNIIEEIVTQYQERPGHRVTKVLAKVS